MEEAFRTAALWMGLALAASILASHLRLSMALVEICVGMVAGVVAERFFTAGALHADADWLRFLANTGAVLLTFLAGAELDPATLRTKAKEVSTVGLIGFFSPFLGCTAVAHYLLGWDPRASLLAGVALSTTSVAVIYSVMSETGLNRSGYGKGVIGTAFINDLASVLALGLIFAPFSWKTVAFVAGSIGIIAVLPRITEELTHRYGNRTAAIRTKWILLVLFGLGALALWAESEAVLPAYVAGIALAGIAAKDRKWLSRLRTLTIGLLTPFYFLRAGSLVSLSTVLAGPFIFLALLGGKVAAKIFGLYPVIARFHSDHNERWFYTLLMSTGLTFGAISSMYGLTHGIITREQYSYLVAGVIASTIVPALIATIYFLPKHHLRAPSSVGEDSLKDE
jgi:Kef-type K+ transport system membrane component KefB